ncbi:MAG: glycerol-3-phosphate acyltransferase, partial [bacterium]
FLGHLYPLFFNLRGGKGVATAAGVLAALSPTLAALLALIWLAVALVFRYSSLAALTAATAAVPLTLWLLPTPSYFALSLLLAALLLWRHRANLRRLMRGEESKLQLAARRRE